MDTAEDTICNHIYKKASHLQPKGSRCTSERRKAGGLYCWKHSPKAEKIKTPEGSGKSQEPEDWPEKLDDSAGLKPIRLWNSK